MRIRILLVALLFTPTISSAHHAFSKDFLINEMGTIQGEVVEVLYQNPHALLYVEVDDGQGGKEVWAAVTQSVIVLSRIGWKKDTYQVGDIVEVAGPLGRDGKKLIAVFRIENQDGIITEPRWRTVRSERPPTSEDGEEPISASASRALEADDFLGHWRITSPLLQAPVPGTSSSYDITIERDGDGYRGWAYNGPFEVELEGEKVVMTLDWTEGSDAEHKSEFIGSVNSNGELVGMIDHGGLVFFTGQAALNGVFSGVRIDYPESDSINRLEDLPPDPVNISGLWHGDTTNLGFIKHRFDLTDTGNQIVENFNTSDAPQIRCAGNGLVTTFFYSNVIINDLEIFQDEEHITLLYNSDYARRVYLDDRDYPDGRHDTYLGFSKGEWKGNTLVVETTHIAPSFLRPGHGHPISGNAYTIEHYTLDEDEDLRAEMWVFDPENYNRPPYFRAIFDKNSSAAIVSRHGCDPKSFFRQMYIDGELEEFFSRGAVYHR